jgi:hypothetical protein
MKELTIEATPENVDKAIEFVDEILEEYGCGMKEQMAIDVADKRSDIGISQKEVVIRPVT